MPVPAPGERNLLPPSRVAARRLLHRRPQSRPGSFHQRYQRLLLEIELQSA